MKTRRRGAAAGGALDDSDAAMQALYRKVTWRIVPFLILLYLVAFLDRVNISFASLTMNRDLGIRDDLFGLAAGIFFLGYLLFAVPSNMMLMRLGARRWIGVLMVTWGILSCSMAFLRGGSTYVLLRFLIGAAESGFFPGVILYLTFWLPGSVRASIMGLFTFSIPLSNMLGAPLSAWILSLGGRGGLHGWQWLFLLEGLPAVGLGIVVPFALASRPEDVGWLTREEKSGLLAAIESEAVQGEAVQSEAGRGEGVGRSPAGEAFAAFRRPEGSLSGLDLVVPGLTYFFLMIGLYALGFWIPRILSSHGVPLSRLGWATALPFLAGGIGMLVWSGRSDRSAKRHLHVVAACLVAALGMFLAGVAPGWPLALAGLALAAVGVLSAMPIFWAALSQRFRAEESAVGIAAVNSVGNLGGFLGPLAIGWLLNATHAYKAGLTMTAVCLVLGAALALRGNTGQLRPEL